MMVGRMSAMSVFNSWDSNAEQNTTPNEAVHTGLRSFIETADSIDEYFLAHPSDKATVADKGMAMCERGIDMFERMAEFAKSASELQGTATEAKKAAGWIGSNLPNGNNNGMSQTFHVGNQAFNSLWRRYG